MGDVILFIDETNSKLRISRCRICHEEEAESFFEVPCACSGTVKFAHRDCIQRWCNEKGNTTCEICLQVYRHGYTAVSKQPKLIEAEVTIRENGQRRRRRRLVSIDESELSQCNSVADRGATFCRSLTFTISMFLLMKHTFDVIYGIEEYPFTVFTVLTLKAIGILLPMFIIIRTIAAIQKSLCRHQYPVTRFGKDLEIMGKIFKTKFDFEYHHEMSPKTLISLMPTESEEDTLSSDDDELEEEEEEQHHLA